MATFASLVDPTPAPAAPPTPAGSTFASLVAPRPQATPRLGTPPPSEGVDLLDALKNAERRGVAGLQWASQTPVGRGADAVLNATSRAGTGLIAGGVGEAAHSFMDPAGATDVTHKAERNLHLPVAADNAPFWQRVGQALEDFGVETAADPATYIPGLDVFSIGKRALGAAKGIEPLAKAGKALGDTAAGQKFSDLVDRAKSGIVEGHDLRKDVTRAGEDVVKGHEIRGKNAQRHQEQAYTDFINNPGEMGRSIRDALDDYDAVRNRLMAERGDYAKIPGDLAQNEVKRIDAELEQAKQAIPPEVRQAFLQRAWREGTPEVRKIVEAKGYTPTAQERQMPALNILHHFNDEYEPTQRLLSDEERDLADHLRAQGPVYYIQQGNRRAKFDLPKQGGTPETSFADRALDRLITGSRLESYHLTRRNILSDLGLMAKTTSADVQRTAKLLQDAQARGDESLIAKYEKEMQGHIEALNEASRLQDKMVKAGAKWDTQRIEAIDPIAAKERAILDAVQAGTPLTKVVTVGKAGKRQKIVALLNPRDTKRDVKTARAKAVGLRSAMINLEQASKGSRDIHGRSNQLIGATQTNRAQAEDAARNALGLGTPPKPRVVKAKPKIETPETPTIGRPPKKKTRGKKSDIILPGEPPKGPAPQLFDASGRPLAATGKAPEIIGKPPRLSKQEYQLRNISEPMRKIVARLQRHADGPVAKHADTIETRKVKAIKRWEDQQRKIIQAQKENRDINLMNEHAKEIEQSINMVPIPENLKRRLFERIPEYNKSLAAEFSDLQRDALFVLPFAHMKNISVLALLGPGGARTLMRGIQYSRQLRRDPAALEDRIRGLEESGATEHFIYESEPSYAGLGKFGKAVGDFADKGNRALERYDLGMRLALEDELKRKGMTDPFAIGGQIRDVIGDYTNQAPLIRELRKRAGAGFPAWGLGVVPRAMTKALREQPRAVKAYARAQRLISDDVTDPSFGADLDMGGPAEDFFSMLERPDKFAASPSRIGLYGLPGAVENAMAYGEPLELAGEQASRMLPFMAPVSNAINWPYSTTAPAVARTAAGLGGAYFKNKKSQKARENELHRLGFKGEQITQILQSEGYFNQPAPPPKPLVPLPFR